MLDRGKKKIPTEDELDASRGQKKREKERNIIAFPRHIRRFYPSSFLPSAMECADFCVIQLN